DCQVRVTSLHPGATVRAGSLPTVSAAPSAQEGTRNRRVTGPSAASRTVTAMAPWAGYSVRTSTVRAGERYVPEAYCRSVSASSAVAAQQLCTEARVLATLVGRHETSNQGARVLPSARMFTLLMADSPGSRWCSGLE